MNTTNKLKSSLFNLTILLFVGLFVFTACTKEEETPEEETPVGTQENIVEEEDSYTVTVGVFILDGGEYIDQNKDLVFITQDECQSWSRTAQGDTHTASSHDHFNAAKNTTYDVSTETITWLEFGPELNQTEIDATCEAGTDGATKTANKTDFNADKNFFLQIKTATVN